MEMLKEIEYDIVHDAQSQYRIILDCYAHPGKIGVFDTLFLSPPSPANTAMANIAMALLNADTSAFVDDCFDDFENYLKTNTSVKIMNEKEAEFLFLSENADPNTILNCNKGELLYPEKGATVIISVRKISEGTNKCSKKINLTGPGIKTDRTVCVDGITDETLNALAVVNAGFPLGIEIILTDNNNSFIVLPRSAKITILKD